MTFERAGDAVFILDTKLEATAVTEANKLGLPLVAVVDTNCDPDLVDYVIPGNDDAIRSGDLMSRVISDAVLEGKFIRSKRAEMAGVPQEAAADAKPAERSAEEQAAHDQAQAEARAAATAAAQEREARIAAEKDAAEAAADEAPAEEAAADEAEKEAAAAPAEEAAAPAAESAGPDGSHEPLDDGSMPEGFEIKGNSDSMKFHQPGGRWYDQTVAEIWFNTPEAATAAGYKEAGKS